MENEAQSLKVTRPKSFLEYLLNAGFERSFAARVDKSISICIDMIPSEEFDKVTQSVNYLEELSDLVAIVSQKVHVEKIGWYAAVLRLYVEYLRYEGTHFPMKSKAKIKQEQQEHQKQQEKQEKAKKPAEQVQSTNPADTPTAREEKPFQKEAIQPVHNGTVSEADVFNPETGIRVPDVGFIKALVSQITQSKEYILNRQARDKLFRELMPLNTKPEEVAVKVSFLSKYLPDNYLLKEIVPQIVRLDVDEFLQMGDEDAVKLLTDYMINGQHKSCYVFAVQYCACHFPKAFPLYDINTDTAMRYFRDCTQFYYFGYDELRDYNKYKRLLEIFRREFKLDGLTLYEISLYLQLTGKQIRQYEKEQMQFKKDEKRKTKVIK